MEYRDPFLNLSPLDHRYWAANKLLFDRLSETLSERAAVRYLVRAEAALLSSHIRGHFNGDSRLLEAVGRLESIVRPEDVAAEEEITRHNIRALVNVIQKHLPEELKPWVHLGDLCRHSGYGHGHADPGCHAPHGNSASSGPP